MSEAARVTDLKALDDFRQRLAWFIDQGNDALLMAETELRRLLDWLQDQLKLWQADVRRCEDEVFVAKQELTRRKMMKIGDRRPDTTEQEKALRLAQARLEQAEHKVARTQYWIRQLPTDILSYEGPARLLQGWFEGTGPRVCALLEQKIETLEEYLRTRVPETPRVENPS